MSILYNLSHAAQNSSFPSNIPSFEGSSPKSRIATRLELALKQVADHLASGDDRGAPEGREIERAAEGIGIAEEQHGRDPAARILEREAALGHLVLLDGAADEVVDGAGRVDLGLVLAGDVGLLGAGEDVEVVVGGVAAGVTLGADSSACVECSVSGVFQRAEKDKLVTSLVERAYRR